MSVSFRAVVIAGLSCMLLAPHAASAEAQPSEGQSCGAWEIEYKLDANLRLSETPMGAGNGVYKIGPGDLVLRFENKDGQPGGNVKMLSYRMTERFTIKAKTVFVTTTVVTDSKTRATPNQCAVVADGVLNQGKIAWTSKVHGYRTDGTLDCSGSLCGTFGAPPSGKSELHIPNAEVQFRPFEMSSNLETLQMRETFAAKTKDPQQTAYVALAGREVKRTCVPAPKACP